MNRRLNRRHSVSGSGRSSVQRYGIRALAMLTLATGVAGGFYLQQDGPGQGVSAEQAYLEADAAERQVLKDDYAFQSKVNAAQLQLAAEAQARAAAEAKAAAERAKIAETEASRRNRNTTTFNAGPIPTSCKVYSGNRATGCTLVLAAGWGLDQMACLDKLFTKESGWNHKARNKSSGAYGIPQALPGIKMASVAGDWETNPATQIKWGLGYIKGRYKTPCGAWQHSVNTGWY